MLSALDEFKAAWRALGTLAPDRLWALRRVATIDENRVAAFDAVGNEVATIFQTASPFDTPRLMRELVDWVRYTRDNKALHPALQRCAQAATVQSLCLAGRS